MRRIVFALFMLVIGNLGHAQALTIEGHTYEATTRVADTEIVLNGVGIRAVAWLKGYTAGLYLPSKAATEAEAVARKGPKRIQMRLMQSVETVEFTKAVKKGFGRNTPAAEQPALQERLSRFERLMAEINKVSKGDIINLDFVPSQGLIITVNGRARGEPIPGEDFYIALMRVFIGQKVSDDKLKAGLLGAKPA